MQGEPTLHCKGCLRSEPVDSACPGVPFTFTHVVGAAHLLDALRREVEKVRDEMRQYDRERPDFDPEDIWDQMKRLADRLDRALAGRADAEGK